MGDDIDADADADAFSAYVNELLSQYPHGLIELALVETLAKNWLTIPMQKGITFLRAAHSRLKKWQAAVDTSDGEPSVSLLYQISLTPRQFSQITGLDAQVTFAALEQPIFPTQSAVE